jgi:hypothetical protein
MFREPLNGEPCLLPVRRDQSHPMTGYRTVIESFIALHEMPEKKLGGDRAYVLPAHRVTPNLAATVIQQVAAARGLKLGPITDAFDARIQGIVSNWPVSVDGARAVALGLPQPPDSVQTLICYVQATPTELERAIFEKLLAKSEGKRVLAALVAEKLN